MKRTGIQLSDAYLMIDIQHFMHEFIANLYECVIYQDAFQEEKHSATIEAYNYIARVAVFRYFGTNQFYISPEIAIQRVWAELHRIRSNTNLIKADTKDIWVETVDEVIELMRFYFKEVKFNEPPVT